MSTDALNDGVPNARPSDQDHDFAQTQSQGQNQSPPQNDLPQAPQPLNGDEAIETPALTGDETAETDIEPDIEPDIDTDDADDDGDDLPAELAEDNVDLVDSDQGIETVGGDIRDQIDGAAEDANNAGADALQSDRIKAPNDAESLS